MTDLQLKDIDKEDIEDLLLKVGASFGIKFVDNELIHIATFGELCDHITNKIQLINFDDCTSQQAFYKLRNAIAFTLEHDSRTITPDSQLSDLLPRQSRRSRIRKVENYVGFKLNILRPAHWVTGTFVIIFLVSLGALFFNGPLGFQGIAFSIIGQWFSNKFGNELKLQTVGQVAEKIGRENYLKSRRDPKTFNKQEMEKVLTDWFSNYLGLDKNKLSRDAKLV